MRIAQNKKVRDVDSFLFSAHIIQYISQKSVQQADLDELDGLIWNMFMNAQ